MAEGWLLEEDEMLKEKLLGMKVYDQRAPAGGAGRDVGVWFRFPEPELRDVSYPFVTIDLLGISEALDRAQRGGMVRPTVQGYRPPDMVADAPAGRVLVTEWPIAMNLDYQVTTWARNIHHDRAMVQQLWTKFPGRYGSVGGNATPYVRPVSAQLTGFTPGDRLDETGKRLFKKMFTIRLFSELWASQIQNVAQVTTVDISVPSLFGNESGWLTSIDCYEGS